MGVSPNPTAHRPSAAARRHHAVIVRPITRGLDPDPATLSPMHAGYVAGRYRDGSWSDHWTDVRRCAGATFTAYRPACRCGWAGPARAADAAGFAAATTTAIATAAEHREPATAPDPLSPRCRPHPRPVLRLVPAL